MEQRGRTPGLILIAVGLFFLLANNGYLHDEYFLLFLGAAFIAAYILAGRRVGLLIAGCVTSVLGIYSIMEGHARPYANGGVFLMMMGAAFVLIYGVHTAHQSSARQRYWPLYPAGVFFLLGALAFASENRYFANWMGLLWPVAIIVLGLMLYSRNRPVGR